MRVLGIDLGGEMGMCHGEPGGAAFPSLRRLSRLATHGARYAAQYDHLRRLIVGNAVTHVFFEAPFVNASAMSRDQISMLFGYEAVIKHACAREAVVLNAVVVGAWRAVIFPGVSPPKELKARKGATRQWWKAKAVAYVQERGFDIESEDVAEAICIWRYGCGQISAEADLQTSPLFDPLVRA